ncbi:hypothetical protein BY996DRAFT_1375378 [Phakopsora pachyrhizi]|nr:hypothetical protein BY996DRAFT_1375378 [Phakopsora pachyrhizi]
MTMIPNHSRLRHHPQKGNAREGDDCSSKSKTLETIEPKRPSPVSGPPFKLKISNIPIDATTESIKTFLEIGSEAYKTARTLNHRIDALGRYVSKYRRSNRQKFPSFQQSELTIYKSNVRTDGIGCDGKAAEGFVENVVKDDGDDDHKIVIVEYGDRRLAMMAYEEFEGKKYLVHDMLCPRLSCQFI